MFYSASIKVRKQLNMKLRSTTPQLKQLVTSSTLVAATVLMVMAVPASVGQTVYADKYDEQIQAAQQEIDAYQGESAKLGKKADTLSNALAKLGAQKATIQSQLDLSQAQRDKLVKEIAENEKSLKHNQAVFGDSIVDLSIEGQVTPVEMLASSGSVGDYLDKQEYLAAVRDKVNDSINQIQTLKKKLNKQKTEVDIVISNQKNQRKALVAKENERASLLRETRGKESAYKGLINDRNSEIASLRSQQAAANAARLQSYGGGASVRAGDPGHGGYPSYLDNAAQDSLVDPWGMYNRECVSYAAWKVQSVKGYHIYGWGNANQWPGSAAGAGVSMGSSPRPHSVAVMSPGVYGHVAWVESVSGGYVTVSQYNWDFAGHYSEMTVPASFFDTYIYF